MGMRENNKIDEIINRGSGAITNQTIMLINTIVHKYLISNGMDLKNFLFAKARVDEIIPIITKNQVKNPT